MDATETGLRATLYHRGVPPHLRDGLVHYVLVGCPVGGFLTVVLENDLMESFGRADGVSRAGLHNLLMWLSWDAPGNCHGSPEKVAAWIEKGGLGGSE